MITAMIRFAFYWMIRLIPLAFFIFCLSAVVTMFGHGLVGMILAIVIVLIAIGLMTRYKVWHRIL